jgi:hypothetical protein
VLTSGDSAAWFKRLAGLTPVIGGALKELAGTKASAASDRVQSAGIYGAFSMGKKFY